MQTERHRRDLRVLVGALVLAAACGREPAEADKRQVTPRAVRAPGDTTAARGTAMPTRPIEQVQEAHTPALMAIPGVVGTYIGATADGRPCINIMVVSRTPELERKLPRALEGYPVEIFESGTIRPLER